MREPVSTGPSDHSPGDSLPAPAPAGPYLDQPLSIRPHRPEGRVPALGCRRWTGTMRASSSTRSGSNTSLVRGRVQRSAWTRPEVAEGALNSLVVRRNAFGGGATAPATVVLTSAPGTAGAGDFTPISQTVQFGPNETQKTVRSTHSLIRGRGRGDVHGLALLADRRRRGRHAGDRDRDDPGERSRHRSAVGSLSPAIRSQPPVTDPTLPPLDRDRTRSRRRR